jgi:hypothetical protein
LVPRVALIAVALEAREHRGAPGAMRGEARGIIGAALLRAPCLLRPLAQTIPAA